MIGQLPQAEGSVKGFSLFLLRLFGVSVMSNKKFTDSINNDDSYDISRYDKNWISRNSYLCS